MGDNADMAMIELVDYNESYNAGNASKKNRLVEAEGETAPKAAAPVVKMEASKEEE